MRSNFTKGSKGKGKRMEEPLDCISWKKVSCPMDRWAGLGDFKWMFGGFHKWGYPQASSI